MFRIAADAKRISGRFVPQNATRERIRQIEAKALRKLKTNRVSRELREYVMD